MIKIIGQLSYFTGSVVGVLLWAIPLAFIVRWRAEKLRSWRIKYKDAYFVSVKAGVATTVIAYLLAFIAYSYFSYSSNYVNSNTYANELQSLENSLRFILTLVGLGVWAYVHSLLLEKLATAYGQPQEVANGITPSVLGFGMLFLLGLLAIISVLALLR